MTRSRLEVENSFREAGSTFIDQQFPPADESIFYPETMSHSDHDERCHLTGQTLGQMLRKYGVLEIYWRRPMLHDRLYDAKGPEVMDIKQGYLGDCWLMSALAALTRKPGFIQRVILNEHVSPAGCYEIKLCVNGKWQTSLIDDHFPVDAHGTPLFARHMNRTLWVALIEKSMAKIAGSYEKLSGGHVGRTLSTLTGSVNIPLFLGGVLSSDAADSLWQKMMAYYRAGFIMTASTLDSSQQVDWNHFESAHLFPGHVYTIVELYESGKQDDRLLRVLTVRNPHSNACSDFYSYGRAGFDEPCSARSEKERKIRELARRALDDRKYVDFTKFQQLFDLLEVCKVRDKVFEARVDVPLVPHYEIQMYSCMMIELDCKCGLDVLIHQRFDYTKCLAEQKLVDLCFIVFMLGEHVPGKSVIAGNVSRSASVIDASVSGEFLLHPGKWLIFPISCHFFLLTRSEWSLRKNESNCTLVVHSDTKFVANLMRPPFGLVADLIHCLRIKEGYLLKEDRDIQLYTIDSLACSFIVARNTSTSQMYLVDCKYTDVSRATRGRRTKDVISPLS